MGYLPNLAGEPASMGSSNPEDQTAMDKRRLDEARHAFDYEMRQLAEVFDQARKANLLGNLSEATGLLNSVNFRIKRARRWLRFQMTASYEPNPRILDSKKER